MFKLTNIGAARLKHGKRFTQQKMRSFLEHFATKRKLNPLLAATWYSIRQDVHQTKVIYREGEQRTNTQKGKVILKKYAGYANAFQNLFPEITFEKLAECMIISL